MFDLNPSFVSLPRSSFFNFSHGEHTGTFTHTLTRVKLVSAFQRDRALKKLFFVTSPFSECRGIQSTCRHLERIREKSKSLLLPGNQNLIDALRIESYKNKKKKSQSLHAPLLIRRFAGYYYYINSILLSFLSLYIDLPR